MIKAVFTVLPCILHSSHAWNYVSHTIQAKAAYDILLEKDPSIIYDVENLLTQYSDRTTEERESEYPFVESITWADDIKRRGGAW